MGYFMQPFENWSALKKAYIKIIVSLKMLVKILISMMIGRKGEETKEKFQNQAICIDNMFS